MSNQINDVGSFPVCLAVRRTRSKKKTTVVWLSHLRFKEVDCVESNTLLRRNCESVFAEWLFCLFWMLPKRRCYDSWVHCTEFLYTYQYEYQLGLLVTSIRNSFVFYIRFGTFWHIHLYVEKSRRLIFVMVHKLISNL